MIELSSMSLAELRSLQVTVAAELQQRQWAEHERARQQIREIAERVGLSVQQLLEGGPGDPTRAKRPAPVKYRDPADPQRQWSGRGRQPRWIVQAQAGGQSLDAFRVA